jgi:hypothetical protein
VPLVSESLAYKTSSNYRNGRKKLGVDGVLRNDSGSHVGLVEAYVTAHYASGGSSKHGPYTPLKSQLAPGERTLFQVTVSTDFTLARSASVEYRGVAIRPRDYVYIQAPRVVRMASGTKSYGEVPRRGYYGELANDTGHDIANWRRSSSYRPGTRGELAVWVVSYMDQEIVKIVEATIEPWRAHIPDGATFPWWHCCAYRDARRELFFAARPLRAHRLVVPVVGDLRWSANDRTVSATQAMSNPSNWVVDAHVVFTIRDDSRAIVGVGTCTALLDPGAGNDCSTVMDAGGPVHSVEAFATSRVAADDAFLPLALWKYVRGVLP